MQKIQNKHNHPRPRTRLDREMKGGWNDGREDASNILGLGRIREGYHLILAIFKFIPQLLGKNAKILIFQDFSGLRNSKS